MGSAMIEPTVIRGSSDPYGSWKMICIRRRILRRASDLSVPRSMPSKRTVPEVASRRRINRAARRALAATGLADESEGLALAHLEGDAVDGLHRPDLALEDPLADREIDLEVLDLDEVGLVRGRGGIGPPAS